MLAINLPFGAGAIWDCYRGFVLRGGAAGAGQRRPAGRDRQPRHAVALHRATTLADPSPPSTKFNSYDRWYNTLHRHHENTTELNVVNDVWSECGCAARRATSHRGVSGALMTCKLAAGGLFCL